MATDPATQKKLDRWIPRLKDREGDVRREALNVIVEVLNTHPQLSASCLDPVTEYVRTMVKTQSEGLYFCLDSLERLDGDVLAMSADLLAAVFECPTGDDTVTGQLMRLLWQQVDQGHFNASNPAAAGLVALAKKVANMPHGGGRRDALRIIDWGEDNL